MKFTAFNLGIVLLLFALPGAKGSNLELLREGNGLQLASAGPTARFKDECGECHGDADEFVRESLMVKNGALIGRYSEKSLADFLKTHQGLKPADVKFHADLLTRVASEIGLQ